MLNNYNSLRDIFVHPESFHRDPLILERSRQTISGALGTLPLIGFTWFLYSQVGLELLLEPVMYAGLMLALTPLISYFHPNHHWAANWAIASLMLGITWTGLLTGGLYSPIIWWCLPVPLLAGNTSGPWAAKGWSIATVCALAFVWAWIPRGIEPGVVFSPELTELLGMTTLLSVLVMVLSAYLSFESAQRELLGELREANTALSEAHLRAEKKVVNLSEQKLVTDRALAETRASLKELASSSSVKTDLLRMVSHDLRSPLSEIMGLTGLMSDEVSEEQESLARYLGLMGHSAQRMRDLLEGLLNLARVEHGSIEPSWQQLDAADLLASIVTDFETRAESKKIFIRKEIDESPIDIVTDMTMFMQIFQNLVSNAVKYSPHNTSITVETRADEDYLWVSVSDQGPGISEADQERMFQPFARLSARPTAGETSTGLGLSIVKSLVGSVEGVIVCDSKVGEGTTFSVRLPREPIEIRELLAG